MGYSFLLRSTPALAYCATPAAALSCHLFIKYSADLDQAAITISLTTHIHGFRDAQDFDFTYNADILVPDGTFIRPATEDLPQTQLSKIARKTAASAPALKTFVLKLCKPCSIRCSRLADCITPKQGHDAAFRQLRDLASVTEVCIVFDADFIHKRDHAAFYNLSNHPDQLAGIPAQAYKGPLSRQVDWTAFGPADDAEHDAEAPPSYDEARAKRRRQCFGEATHPGAGSSSPGRSPPAKRERVETDLDCWGSPTEKATTEERESPSPRALSPPYQTEPNDRETTKAALEALLPEALQKALPDMLARVFAVPRPATSDPLATGSLGALIMSQIASDVVTRLQPRERKAIEKGCMEAVKQMSRETIKQICAKSHEKILKDMLDYAHDLRDGADIQFFQELEDHTLNLTVAKDEGMEEIRREVIAKREDLVATAQDVEAQTGAKLQEQADEAWEQTKWAVSMREELLLERISEIVGHRHPPSAPPRQRAGSVPL
ncbi:hypothetical protein PMIN01_12013 [Paraphaeosphaeria minitans]|uniref:Uncharacterized protein n=1 Tax=Paraphaeosphaeria minitans TaxID=565426 RepID=A0A9P6G7W5_9PLEO|nr:hypothetical protein PMIN01_12013 [Paraphaeosphaeria minitans]